MTRSVCRFYSSHFFKRATHRTTSARTHVFSRSVLLLRKQPPWGVKGTVDGLFSFIFNIRKISLCCLLEHTVRASIPNAADYGDRAFRDGRTDTFVGKHGTLS